MSPVEEAGEKLIMKARLMVEAEEANTDPHAPAIKEAREAMFRSAMDWAFAVGRSMQGLNMAAKPGKRGGH